MWALHVPSLAIIPSLGPVHLSSPIGSVHLNILVQGYTVRVGCSVLITTSNNKSHPVLVRINAPAWPTRYSGTVSMSYL